MTLTVFIDGSCVPNPGGIASYGLIIYEFLKCLLAEGKVCGQGLMMSNNVAEYKALLAFFDWYKEHGDGRNAFIFSDSQLLVKQMNGEWGATAGQYVPFYGQAIRFYNQKENLQKFTFQWIPREKNIEADALSKDALLQAGVPQPS